VIRRYCTEFDIEDVLSHVEASVDGGGLCALVIDMEVDALWSADLDERMTHLGWHFVEADPATDVPTFVLKSPDGTAWNLSVKDDGTLETTEL